MKLQLLNKEGKKVKEIESGLFDEPIREDIIRKVVEAEKLWQPYANKYLSGMNRSASGRWRKKRHAWKSNRGKGLSRIPRKTLWRRGTQFAWQGAIIPGTKSGRRAHPPKNFANLKKINKKELKKALLSALHYVADKTMVSKKYARIQSIEKHFPLVVQGNMLELKTNDFMHSLQEVLGSLFAVSIQDKQVRTGKGKMRGRKYKMNQGLLFVVGKDEKKEMSGIEVVGVDNLLVSDLASQGARLTLFSEQAVAELEAFKEGKEVVKKKITPEKKRVDRRKMNHTKNDQRDKEKKLNKSKVKEKEDA